MLGEHEGHTGEQLSRIVPDVPTTKVASASLLKVDEMDLGLQNSQSSSTSSLRLPDTEVSPRGFRFRMCIFTIMISAFLAAMSLSGVATALPVIIHDLHATQFEWVGSAFSLSATAFMPMIGGLAQGFGRRPVLLVLLSLSATGSALCGSAHNIDLLIAGRVLQGIGAGGINSLIQIILLDLVPLRQRGTYNGFITMSIGVGTAIAPLIGGSLAAHGVWRWFFYMNIPISCFSGVLALVSLKLNIPRKSWKERLLLMDWVGNAIIIGSTTSVILSLTLGGINFPWDSPHILAPLLLGCCGLAAFVIYEAKVPDFPVVPLKVMNSRTSMSGYLQNFLITFYTFGLQYYLPVYFQGCKDASPIASAVDTLVVVYLFVPFSVATGRSIAKLGRFRPQLWVAWCLLTVAAGLMSTLRADSSRGKAIGFQVIAGIGLGIGTTSTYYPVLSAVPLAMNANAVGVLMFSRYLAQAWGVTVGGTIIQNELTKRLPTEFTQRFPAGSSVAYSIIPTIATLEEPLKGEVQEAFASSMRVLWLLLIGVAGLGLLVSLLMKGLPLQNTTNKEWGLKEVKDTEALTDGETEIAMDMTGNRERLDQAIASNRLKSV